MLRRLVLLPLLAGIVRACPGDEVPFPDEECVSYDAAAADAMAFLRSNAPPWDLTNAVTLFGEPGGVDGLEVGVASLGAGLALAARRAYPWAAAVPRNVFYDYVLPYACTNEPRTNWRPLFTAAVAPLVHVGMTLDQVIASVNAYGPDSSASVWSAFGEPKITFKSAQTPLVFDPVSTVAFRQASCTGISITLVSALRAVGVAARVVGTPAWRGDPGQGNHNWVEIYREGSWAFIEGHPAGGGETLDDPCDKWFCTSRHFPAGAFLNTTEVFAARFDTHHNTSVFPLAWDTNNQDVPGEDRTAYYRDACAKC